METVSNNAFMPDMDIRLPGFVGVATEKPVGLLTPLKELASYHELVVPDERLLTPIDRSQGIPESLIGPTEDRDPVEDTRRYPYSAICALRIIDQHGKQHGGTGFLVGANLVLTAGHNVFKHSRRGFVKYVYVYPGLDGDLNSPPFGSVRARSFRTVGAWANDANQTMDFGAIVLPNPIGTQTGWFSVARLTSGTLAGLAVTVSGYPIICPRPGSGDCGAPHTTQWGHQANLSLVEPARVRYSIDTTEGQSGAPVFAYFPDKDDPFQAVAIHNYGFDVYNAGTRINYAVFDTIVKWIEDAEHMMLAQPDE